MVPPVISRAAADRGVRGAPGPGGGPDGASGAGAAALGEGPVRAWRGMLIQSLDPVPQSASGMEAPRRRSRSGVDARADGNRVPSSRRKGVTRVPPDDRVLSDERAITRWAYAADPGPIFAGPDQGSGQVWRLRRSTDEGFPEVYLLLRLRWDAAGQEWVKLRIPMRPNGQVGWVPREALGRFHPTRDLLVVDRRGLRMGLFTRGRLRWSAPVAVGRRSAATLPGQVWINSRFKVFDSRSGYWPYAFGTTDYSTSSDWPQRCLVGIHGPGSEPNAIPGRPSQGSFGLKVADDTWLAEHLGLGTPLLVR